MFNNMTLRRTLRVVVAMLHLLNQVNLKRQPMSVLSHTAKVETCSSEILNKRRILDHPTPARGRLECVRQCLQLAGCEFVVFQEFANGSATCTKMSIPRADSTMEFDAGNSKICTAFNVNPCLNQGQFQGGICLCPDGYTGQTCEYTNPSFCSTKWREVTRLEIETRTLYMNADNVKNFHRATPKVKFRNNALNVDCVMRSMYSDNQATDYWYLLTFLFMEKAAWNRFADNPRRQIIHFMGSGQYQTLNLNGASRTYSFDNHEVGFAFLAPVTRRLQVVREMPEDWALMADDLSDGADLEDVTLVSVDASKQTIVAQLADSLLQISPQTHFTDPPIIRNIKYVIGKETLRLNTQLYSGIVSGANLGSVKQSWYLDPCWTAISRGKFNKDSLLQDWRALGAYLRLGKNVRVNLGTGYQKVIEVIQTGDDLILLLAPTLTQEDPLNIASIYGVRSLVTSSNMYASCTHQIEGEGIIKTDKYPTEYTVVWFVDTRRWTKVFAVFSNSTVAHGSVSDLASRILAGSDTRIWIEWLETGVSRFMETQMSSVTDQGQVSTESLVTWGTTIGSEVSLSPTCDLQYILVTSKGHVEVLSFNIMTPGKSKVQTDVMVTWFLS